MGFFWFVAFLIFSGAFLAAGYYAFSVPRNLEVDKLTSRMRELRVRHNPRAGARADLIRREEQGTFAFVTDFFQWLGLLRRLQEFIEQANMKYRASDVFLLSLIIFAVVYLILGLLSVPMAILRVFIALLFACIPTAYIMKVRSRRMSKFEDMLPDTIDLFNRTMKAGHNIHSGLETIASETSDPVKMEFKKVVEELALGSQIESALHGLGKRVPIIDLKFFITSLILQRQTGANMVTVLENLSTLVRERLNLTSKMKAATASQRFSAGLICAMPIIMGVGMWFLKPDMISILWKDETGSMFLTYAIISEIVGILVIRALSNLKV